MVGRRRQDPVLAAEVRDRLLRILAESGPRRVRPAGDASLLMAEPAARTAEGRATSRATAPDEGLGSLLEESSDFFETDDDDLDELFTDDPATDEPARHGPPNPRDEPTTSLPGRAEDNSPAESRDLDSPEKEVSAPSSLLREGRWPFRRVHLVVIGVLLVVGLLGAGWAVLRARSVAIETPVARPSPVATSAKATPEPEPQTIMVHVLGAVRKPGVVELADGSRVSDALEAAGGLKGKADPGELNLAQVLADGQQIVVGTDGEPEGEVRDGGGGSASAGGGSGGSAEGGGQVDLNRATQEQLESLPGVGPVTAQKIIAWRDEHERFSRIEELQEVAGIGPKTYAEIAPHVTV